MIFKRATRKRGTVGSKIFNMRGMPDELRESFKEMCKARNVSMSKLTEILWRREIRKWNHYIENLGRFPNPFKSFKDPDEE